MLSIYFFRNRNFIVQIGNKLLNPNYLEEKIPQNIILNPTFFNITENDFLQILLH